MMDRRWIIIPDPYFACAGGFTITGAGVPGCDGTYCPDAAPFGDGSASWTKRGGVIGEDTYYYVAALDVWYLTSGGLASASSLNIKYLRASSDLNFATVWVIYDATYSPPGGGVGPPPVAQYLPVHPPVIRDLGPLQYAKFSEEEDLSVGLIAKRRKLTTDIVFTGADFDYFLAIERDPTRRCEELVIRRQWRCDGKWKTVWTGSFSTGSGSWDFDLCQFTVKPDVMDEYTCIMRAMDRRVNVLQAPSVDVNAIVISSGIEFGICFPGSSGEPGECGSKFGAFGWDLALTFVPPAPYGGSSANLYWREKVLTLCVNGTPVAPVGTGWFLIANNCSGVYNAFMEPGTAWYARMPTLAYTFGDPIYCGPLTPGYPDCCSPSIGVYFYRPWSSFGLTDPEEKERIVNPGDSASLQVCLSLGLPIEYVGRTLQETSSYLLNKAGCDQLEMVSDFLEWNAPGDAPGYAPGINYVTGSNNRLNHLVLLQNSDAADPAASNPATRGEMTMREFFSLLSISVRLYWAIDAVGRIRIEHWSFWTTPVGLVLSNYANGDKSEPQSYAHLKSEIPQYERPRWQHAQNMDFKGVDIEYSGPCVSSEGDNIVREYNAGPFTTDLSFIVSDPDEISKQGFTLLATRLDGPVYNVIIELGALSSFYVTNTPLSWANLERDFWQHDRFLPTGTMNRVLTEFMGFVPNIEQRNVFLRFCCEYTDFDSSERVATKLGAKLGNINAFIRRAEFDEAADGLTLTLRYAY